MRVGGNAKAKKFFASQPDFNPDWSLTDKYNSRAAALLRDKITTEAAGGTDWSEITSSARDYKPPSQQLTRPSSTSRNLNQTASSSASNLHPVHSDLEVWLHTSDSQSSNVKSSGGLQRSVEVGEDLSAWVDSHSDAAGGRYNPGMGCSSSEYQMSSKSQSDDVWQTIRDAQLMETLSKGADSLSAKLQSARDQGMRSFETYWGPSTGTGQSEQSTTVESGDQQLYGGGGGGASKDYGSTLNNDSLNCRSSLLSKNDGASQERGKTTTNRRTASVKDWDINGDESWETLAWDSASTKSSSSISRKLD